MKIDFFFFFNKYLIFKEQITDIEEMTLQGKKFGICPYYASRANVSNAEILCMPYVSLCHKPTREKFGITLKNSIIIIDEAHNLLETIGQINSFSLNFKQICQIYSQLKQYQDKYQKRLKAKNSYYVNQLCLFLNNIRNFLQNKHLSTNKPNSYIPIRILDFLVEINAAAIEFTKLQAFVENSQLSKKLNMFIEKTQFEAGELENNKSTSTDDILRSPMNILDLFIDFFMGLLKTNDKESIFLIKFAEKLPESSLNLLRLDAESNLKDILLECHSMVLAGGTMEPISEYNFIKKFLTENQYHNFSCGHIIKNNQFKALVVSKSKNERELIFNFESKKQGDIIIYTVEIIEDIAKIIPDGLIIFVQSYGFLDSLNERMKILKINEKLNGKRIFFDSKNSNKIVSDYEREINGGRGAILVSVMGGRLSEGINFNDKLARGIIVLGLPFNNIKAPEIIEKSKFAEKKGINYQENACMKVINQTIGRAIRHKKDYAMVFLVDKRFENLNVQEKLPGWIREGVEGKLNFKEVVQKTQEFFKNIGNICD